MKEKILVTGGTGYIGSHTVVELQNLQVMKLSLLIIYQTPAQMLLTTLKRYQASVLFLKSWIAWTTPVLTLCLPNIKALKRLFILQQVKLWESLWRNRCFIIATTWSL